MNQQQCIQVISQLAQNLNCTVHGNQITHLCSRSEKEEQLFELLCPSCYQENENIKDAILYPDGFFNELESSLKLSKKTTTPSQQSISNFNLSENFNEIEDLVKILIESLNSLEISISTIKKNIEDQFQTLKGLKNEADQTDNQFILSILNKLASATSLEELAPIFDQLKHIKSTHHHAFPLQFARKHQLKLEKINSDVLHQSLREHQKYYSDFLNNCDKFLRKISTSMTQNYIDSFEEANFSLALSKQNFNNFSQICSVHLLDTNIACCIGHQNQHYFFTVFKLGARYEITYAHDLGKEAVGNLNHNIARIDSKTVAFGVKRQIYVVDFRENYLTGEVGLDFENQITCLELENEKRIFVADCKTFRVLNQSILEQDPTDSYDLIGHQGLVRQLVQVPFSPILISCSDDQTIIIWKLEVKSILHKIELAFCIYSISLNEDNTQLYFSGNSKQISSIELGGNFQTISLPNTEIEIFHASSWIFHILAMGNGVFLADCELGVKFFQFQDKHLYEPSDDYQSFGQCWSLSTGKYQKDTIIMFADKGLTNLVQIKHQ